MRTLSDQAREALYDLALANVQLSLSSSRASLEAGVVSDPAAYLVRVCAKGEKPREVSIFPVNPSYGLTFKFDFKSSQAAIPIISYLGSGVHSVAVVDRTRYALHEFTSGSSSVRPLKEEEFEVDIRDYEEVRDPPKSKETKKP